MKPKTIKITYWVLLIILCLFMAFDGIGGVTKNAQGVEALKHLGYPIYIMPLMGALKLLGIIVLLQTKYQGIKEWVFAGMAFIFIGATVTHICSGDPTSHIMMPLIFLAYLFLVRFFWLRYEQTRHQA